MRRWGPLALTVAVAALTAACSTPGVEGAATPSPRPSVLRPVPWDGGPGYYARFGEAARAGWAKPSFFPIGIWYASVHTAEEVAQDKAAGINTYVELTDDSDVRLLRSKGMSALTSGPLPGAGAETVGWLIGDEADMWGGPGDGAWTGTQTFDGTACTDKDRPCGYTAMRTLAAGVPNDGRLRYANYGKGVMYWESDEQAAKFVNGFTDIVSTDLYWYTNVYACDEARQFMNLPPAQCRLAANYGAIIDRQRALDARDGRLQPVYAFIELGYPGKKATGVIRPEQMKGAVMSSLIHGARGVIYFNHSFGGSCQSMNLLRDQCGDTIRPAVTEINRQIAALAPVLNTQSYEYDFAPGVDAVLKRYKGSYYLFAMVARGARTGARRFALPPALAGAKKAEVLFEDRTVPIDAGGFGDTFEAEYAYHIYKITP
ncbi:hypothetical protein JOL79_21695 [Microbispora sp. RL4-1S]|uniref:Glycoside hydrolase family 42 N-terminal domain-containing protein n=1 Tax=Microbispora oryzae TaxID=2806554 RepID=A0A940WNR2_9ACTN|nr:hypothetical protein [Microbispora oryzae]MBP2706428.1 hypothetical protein [Microbispora oryzae]